MTVLFSIGGDDYDNVLAASSTTDVSFGPGRKRRSPETLYCTNITIIADELVERDEFFTVALSTSDEDVVLFPQNATIVIMNNDCEYSHHACAAHIVTGTCSLFQLHSAI